MCSATNVPSQSGMSTVRCESSLGGQRCHSAVSSSYNRYSTRILPRRDVAGFQPDQLAPANPVKPSSSPASASIRCSVARHVLMLDSACQAARSRFSHGYFGFFPLGCTSRFTKLFDDRSVVVLEIDRTIRQPVSVKGESYIRIGSRQKKLRECHDAGRRLWKHLS